MRPEDIQYVFNIFKSLVGADLFIQMDKARQQRELSDPSYMLFLAHCLL